MADKTSRNTQEPQSNHSEEAEIDINRLPSEVVKAYRTAYRRFVEGRSLDEDALEKWKMLGVDMAAHSTRSWEAAVAYFEESPAVKKSLGKSQFMEWGELGAELVVLSPPLAMAYFRASRGSLEASLPPRHVTEWGEACKKLHSGTWKSGTLVCNLFDASPALLHTVPYGGFRIFVEFLGVLATRSVEMAERSLKSSVILLPKFGDNARDFVELSYAVAVASWRDVQPLYQNSEQFLVPLEADQRSFIFSLMKRAVKTGAIKVPLPQIMRNGAEAVSLFQPSGQTKLFDLVDRLASTSIEAANGFLVSVATIRDRLNFKQIEAWSEYGINYSKGDPKAATEYFGLRTDEAVRMLESLSSAVELKPVESVLRMYCQALSGESVEIKATEQLIEKHIGWFQKDMPAIEGGSIYLPSSVNQEKSKEGNFAFYKVMATHQTGHIEFGSFEFEFGKKSRVFRDMRPKIEETQIGAGAVKANRNQTEDVENGAPSTNIGRFFALFSDDQLARDLFGIVESARVDACVNNSYKGIVKAYRRVQDIALSMRPDVRSLPAKEALVELLVRMSLGQTTKLYAPADQEDTAQKMRSLIRKAANKNASVEDSAEATVRIYALLTGIENKETDQFNNLPEDEPTESEDKQEDGLHEDDMLEEFILRQLMMGMNTSGHDEEGTGGEGGSDQDENGYDSPQQVDYRGDFKPELTQIMNMLQEGRMPDGAGEESVSLTPEQLEEMLKNAPEANEGEEVSAEEAAQISKNMMKNLQSKGANMDVQGDANNPSHTEEDGGLLEATEPNSYLYDEWDFRMGEYKKGWCLLHEKEISVGEPNFYREVLAKNVMLVREIRTQFEMIAPELSRKHKRLTDGEEADFDSALEALIDIRAMATPEERIYWRRNKTERSVAVVFLLDMSASTAEAIEDAKKITDDWSAPDDPTEYMAWLRSRRAKGNSRGYKRIIDVEKDGVVLLVNALETLGDHYGIYGFSGYGRDNVEFYVIKDLEEKFDPKLTSGRIDRIAPLHATRMGPAIRHATTKLVGHEAKTKYLFLISDGRPQDRGYSREGVEKEYAVHDTRKALQEARRESIRPFCLTVDKSGHDYLKTMMEDFNYEVLSDIRLLPKRLLQLYKNLTA